MSKIEMLCIGIGTAMMCGWLYLSVQSAKQTNTVKNGCAESCKPFVSHIVSKSGTWYCYCETTSGDLRRPPGDLY